MFTIANLLKLFLFCKVQLRNEHNEDKICEYEYSSRAYKKVEVRCSLSKLLCLNVVA